MILKYIFLSHILVLNNNICIHKHLNTVLKIKNQISCNFHGFSTIVQQQNYNYLKLRTKTVYSVEFGFS